MRALVVMLLMFTACDHRPAPPPPPAPQTAPGDAAAAAPTGGDVCTQIGVKIAEIIISATTDPTAKAAYEQERTRMVKRFSDNCTREKWPDPIKSCFLAAKTQADAETCSRQLAQAMAGSAAAQPRPTPPPQPAPTPTDGGLKRE